MLAFDIGGTHTRAVVTCLRKGAFVTHPALPNPVERRVCTKGELVDFIQGLVTRLRDGGAVEACALGLAGVALSEGRFRVTNWPGHPTVGLGELMEWGLPEGRTRLLNDLDAAAFGLLDLIDHSSPPSSSCLSLYLPDGMTTPDPEANRVLLVPGTGLGTLGIVTFRDGQGGLCREHVPSEVQHSLASPLDWEHLELFRTFAIESADHRWPSWEDLVSGSGLVRSYRALGRLRGLPASPPGDLSPDPAAEIARRAVAGSDPLAEAALELYYRAVARVAQILALVYQPRGGIFLAGGSSRKNRAFILRGPFVRELQDNPAQGPLLAQFPVFLVLEELNLRGALCAAREVLAP